MLYSPDLTAADCKGHRQNLFENILLYHALCLQCFIRVFQILKKPECYLSIEINTSFSNQTQDIFIVHIHNEIQG